MHIKKAGKLLLKLTGADELVNKLSRQHRTQYRLWHYLIVFYVAYVAASQWLDVFFGELLDLGDDSENLAFWWGLAFVGAAMALIFTSGNPRTGVARSLIFSGSLLLSAFIFSVLIGTGAGSSTSIVFLLICGFACYYYFRLRNKPDHPDLENIFAISKHLTGLKEYYETHLKAQIQPQEHDQEKSVLTSWVVLCVILLFFGTFIPSAILIICCMAGYDYSKHKNQPNHPTLEEIAAQSKYLSGFKERYETHLKEWMQVREQRRKKAMKKLLVVLCAGLPLGALTMGFMAVILPEFICVLVAWAIIAAVFYYAMADYTNLKRDVKKRILSNVTECFEHLKYEKSIEDFDIDKFSDLYLVPRYNRYSFQDGFRGRHDKITFVLTEADLSYNTSDDYEHAFFGLLIMIAFPLPFQGRTILMRDKGKIGNWLSSKPKGVERVNLVMSGFENVFETYSTDQIEARVILTPDLMEKVLELVLLIRGFTEGEDETSRRLDAADAIHMGFEDNVMMIAISGLGNLFEVGDLDVDMTDTRRVASFAHELSLIYEIIDVLELNRKALTFSAIKANPPDLS